MSTILSAAKIKELLEREGIYNSIGKIVITLNGINVTIKKNDIIGNALQEWLEGFLVSHDIYFRPQPLQEFPDLYLGESNTQNLCEMKTFYGPRRPAFDIANFMTYINSIADNAYRLDSDYIIFSYTHNDDGEIMIQNIYCKKVWEIAGPAQSYPLNVQRKNGQIVNIRPIDWRENGGRRIQPFASLLEFLVALYQTYLNYTNSVRTTNDWINSVLNGYYEHCGQDLRPQLRQKLPQAR
ncbi:MAG: NgoBV family restriction endonuclease [Spirochaetia bacterium]|nr:NgoBV family restriction endonuclease [Spirochaetia bacterium]